MATSKYYVVWRGRKRGIFTSWPECEKQVSGFVGAEYKAFGSLDEARVALQAGYAKYRGKAATAGKWKLSNGGPRLPSICVDAACAGSPGPLEYRGVDTKSGRQIFRAGPFAEGTNNVGEFLAIVEALRWLETHGRNEPIYSDSQNAISWIRQRKCRTKLQRTAANRRLFEMIAHALADLPGLLTARRRGETGPSVLKWETSTWGENPADFGRK